VVNDTALQSQRKAFFGADETGLKKIKTVIRKLSKKHLAFITLLSVCIGGKTVFWFQV
jgi:hypothetical protein